MKKLTLTLLLALSSSLFTLCKAQYVTIPDANFAAWLDANIPSAMSGNQMDTTSAAVTTLTSMSVGGLGIANLSGIQYFTSLTSLSCGDNLLTSLPALPPSLGTLQCNNNPLASLPALPAGLTMLFCSYDSLTSLPTLPAGLTNFVCMYNKLTSLPALPAALNNFQCDNNQLSFIPALPAGLIALTCSYNQLTGLSPLPSGLEAFNCSNNLLTGLPALPAALFNITCSYNNLSSIPTLPSGLSSIDCRYNLLSSLPALPATLLILICSGNNLTNLPTLPGSLGELGCAYNPLTSLPTLPAGLVSLYCAFNNLTSLPALPSTLNLLECQNNTISCFPVFPASLNDSTSFYFDISPNPFNCLPNYVGGMNAATLAYPLCGTGNPNACPVASVDVLVTHSANVTCNGGNNGSATTLTGGGTPPYTYQWVPAGGTDSTATGLVAGTYTIIITDSNSVTTSATVTITQPAAISISSIITDVNCIASNDGSITANVSGGTPPYTYSWSNGQTNASDTGLVTGNYSITVTDANGCSATVADSVPTDTLFTAIYASPDTVTIGDSVYLTAYANVGPDTYVWNWGGTNQTVVVYPVVNTTYTCQITTPCGVFLDTITVYAVNCSNTFNEPICIATIDTATNKAEVIWGRTNSPPSGGYGSYNIYKDTLSAYTLIHSQALDSLSQYLDVSSFPSDGPESYELATVDSCGESSLSTTHTTIYLTTTSGVNVYILNWTAYVGFTPTVYRIFRGPSMNALVQIDSVPPTTLTFHDTLPPAGSFYLLEAVSPFGVCVPTTLGAYRPSVNLSGSFSNGYNAGAITTGTNQLKGESEKVKVYPNPNNGIFTIVLSHPELVSSAAAEQTIDIYNVLGEKIYTSTLPPLPKGSIRTNGGGASFAFQLNISSQPEGIYLYRVISENGNLLGEGKVIIDK